MYAIVEFKGFQYWVEKGEEIAVSHLLETEGNSIVLDQVLMVADNDNVVVGKPTVENARIQATVVRHYKDDKIIVFKFKRRKDYRRKNGHRQQLSVIRIDDIIQDLEVEKNGS